MTPAIETLGKYQILEELGRGGFATVYRARDTTLGRDIALKLLDPLLMRDEAFVGRFEREARAAAALDHPHIVPIYEVGSADQRLYIAMRLVRGESLAHRLEAEPRMPWQETLALLRQVCDALEYAHEQGVVHRDIKPHNILLDPRGGAMLSDFGFARLVGTSSLTQSVSGGTVGTPAYIAPEIWDGAPATPATDVYSLACVLCEMLTGRVLFGGETPMAVMRAHDRGARLPEKWPAGIPDETGTVMARALDRDPAQRYGRVCDFLASLEALQTAAANERLAQEKAQLFSDARAALGAGRVEEAVATGQRLVELAPGDRDAVGVLEEAQAGLEKRSRLAAQLAQQLADLEADRRALEEQQAALKEEIGQVEAEVSRLGEARAAAERQLAEVTGLQDQAIRARGHFQDVLARLASRARELAGRADRLERAAGCLDAPDLSGAERWLAAGRSPQGVAARVAPSPAQEGAGAEESTEAARSVGGGRQPLVAENGVVLVIESLALLAGWVLAAVYFDLGDVRLWTGERAAAALFLLGWLAALATGSARRDGKPAARMYAPRGLRAMAGPLVVSMVALPLAVGLVKRRNRARTAALVAFPLLAGLSVAVSTFMVKAEVRVHWQPGGSAVGAASLVFCMWAFFYLLRPGVKAWFGQKA